jgi:hypothetical protein
MEVTMTEMAAGEMAVAAEMTTTEVTAAMTATECESGGRRERSDSNESKSEFAKHFQSPFVRFTVRMMRQ